MRVSEVQRERYTLIGQMGEIGAKLKGNLYNSGDFPVVGDYVEVIFNPYGDSLIEKILERKTYLSRPDRSGHADGYVKSLVEQPMASNFDYVFIVTSLLYFIYRQNPASHAGIDRAQSLSYNGSSSWTDEFLLGQNARF